MVHRLSATERSPYLKRAALCPSEAIMRPTVANDSTVLCKGACVSVCLAAWFSALVCVCVCLCVCRIPCRGVCVFVCALMRVLCTLNNSQP